MARKSRYMRTSIDIKKDANNSVWQLIFTCSKSTIEILEIAVKYVQN